MYLSPISSMKVNQRIKIPCFLGVWMKSTYNYETLEKAQVSPSVLIKTLRIKIKCLQTRRDHSNKSLGKIEIHRTPPKLNENIYMSVRNTIETIWRRFKYKLFKKLHYNIGPFKYPIEYLRKYNIDESDVHCFQRTNIDLYLS